MTPKMISPEELNDNFDNVRSGDWSLVDVRDAFDYRAAHIPMAALMPSGYTENMIGQVNPDNVVVLYCKTGIRSRQRSATSFKFGPQKRLLSKRRH